MLCFFILVNIVSHFYLVLLWFDIRLGSLGKVLRKSVVHARSERVLHRWHENVNFR